jgi:hypothetical protein
MRFLVSLAVVLAFLGQAHAQTKEEKKLPARYGVENNPRLFPQGSAKETLASVIRAYEEGRFSYVASHLADPDWVDKRVKDIYGGDVDGLIKAMATKFADDPSTLKEMKRFLKEGDWEDGETTATVKHKDIKDRQMTFRKIGKLWYLENRTK